MVCHSARNSEEVGCRRTPLVSAETLGRFHRPESPSVAVRRPGEAADSQHERETRHRGTMNRELEYMFVKVSLYYF